MEEIELNYETLFKIISIEEQISYKMDKEYFQATPIQVLDENNNWIGVKGLITKSSPTLHIEIDVDEHIDCATTHLVQLEDKTLKYANMLEVGARLNSKDGYATVTNIIVKDEIETVFDIEVDSDTHLYQIANGTIHHNTLLTSAIIKYANEINMKTITIVPSSSLLKQTHDYIKQFDIPVGMFGGGKKDDEINMVCTWQTLQNNKPFIRDFECIIWDECIHPSGLVSMSDNTTRRIDTVSVGDMIKTYNENTKQVEDKKILKVHKNLLKSRNQKMFKITLEDNTEVLLTGNHEVLTETGWKRADTLTMDDNIISLSEQLDFHIVEFYINKQYNMTMANWFGVTPTTISRWKSQLPLKYKNIFKHKTDYLSNVDLINRLY